MLDVLKSKSMVGFVILIIGISFMGTNQVQTFENNNDVNFIEQA